MRSLVRTLGQVMQQKRGKMGGEGSTISLKRLLICGLLRDASTDGKKECSSFPPKKNLAIFRTGSPKREKKQKKLVPKKDGGHSWTICRFPDGAQKKFKEKCHLGRSDSSRQLEL